MLEIRNSEVLQRWLLESGHLARLWDRPRFFFDAGEFEAELAGVRMQYPQFNGSEAEARAALRLLGKEEGRSRALVVSGPRRWTRRERMFLLAVLALAAAVAALLFAPRAHAQLVGGTRSSGIVPLAVPAEAAFERYRFWNMAEGGHAPFGGWQGQPTGVIWQWQQGGSALHTFAGGIGFVNCSTNLTCAYSANPPTITISASGGSGSGCVPPGTTANALLFDAGSGGCNDVASFTWNSGTSTMSLLSGGTLALANGGTLNIASGTVDVPGTNGQLLYNNSGALAAEDPVVSGPDARGAAQSKNPVAGLAGIDYGTGCSGGPCVQEAKVDSSGNQYVSVTNSSLAVTGTFWQTTQPVSWSGQSVALTGSWPYSGALGNVGGLGTAGSPSGGVFSIQGVSGGSAVPVSGTFWQTTQPVSLASLPALASGSNTIGAVTQASGPWTINLTQINGNTAATVANGTLEVGVADASGNGITSNSTTYSSKHGLDVNLLGSLGTAFTTAGVVNIQGIASGTAVPVSGTFWQTTQPVSWSGQSVSLTGSWPY